MSLAKASLNRSVSDSDCDGEEYLINVDDNKPPSPLSVQYDGVSLPVQSPPFENGSNEKPSSTLSDCSNPVDLDVNGEFTTNKDADCTQPCPIITWESDGHQVFQKASVEPVVSTVLDHEGAATTKNGSSGNVHETNTTEELSSHQPAKINSPRRMPVKKSVQQLYGQPSWWGDGEDNYSYPHTSLLGAKETAEMEETSVSSVNTPIAEQDVRPHPRSEAFVIDFGPTRSASESRGPVPGSLSQCVPDRLRRGFVERERLKREREKENELRRQTMPTECGPVRQNSQRSTRSVTLRAANAKLSASAGGRPATAKIGTGGRGLHPPKARPSTATPERGRGGGPTRRPAPLDTTAQSVRTTSQESLTPRRAAGSLPTSPLVRASKTTGSVSVTPRHTNPATTCDLLGGAISRVTALQAVTTRTGLTMARRSTAIGMNTSSTPRKLSQGTDRSAASRRTAPAPVSTTRPRGTTGTTAGRTGTTGTRAESKPTTTGRTRGGLQTREPVTRGFMSATASSGAKRVQPNSSSSRPPTGSTAHPSPRQSAGTVGPAPVNSVKRPITSTQLRCRPASSTRTTACRPLTNPPEKRGSARSHGSLHRTMSEVTANMMATMEAYGDPKAYLFYRMFQGADEAEPSTDSVFKTFISESPMRSAGPKRGLTVGAIPHTDFDAALAQTEWLHSYPDQEQTMHATTTLSPDPGVPSPMQFDPEGDGKLFATNTSQVPFCSNHAPGVAPEGKKTKPSGSHIHDATKPTASDSSPVMQHRQATRHNNNQLSSSMLVGTSVTSLAGTYILEKGSVLLDTGIENGSQNLTTSLGRPHEQDPTDQLHSRTNLARLQETEEEQNGPESESLRRTSDLEGRTHRTYVNNDNIILNSTLPVASPSQTGRSALDAAITYDSLRQTNNNAVESHYSPAPAGSGTQRGPGVALERPDRSPSNSSTPPTAGTIPDGLAVTTSSSSLTASLFRAVDGDQLSSPKPCSSSELHSRPRSTYAPLSDIHNCYRALQQSMNYLIQSQTGLLPDAEYAGYNNNDDDSNTIAFDLPAVSSFNTEYGNLPVRIGQTSGAVGVHSAHVTDCRVPCSSAAVWPPDLTHKNSTGVRRSLSRQNRADRQRQSTASLDSALHITMDQLNQLAQTYRSQSLRTGFASVPEPASPTGSGSSPVTNGWCSTRRPEPLPDMNLSVPPTSGDVPTTGTHPMRAMNPLNRTYDFSAQNGPQVLSHDLDAGICDPSMGKDHLLAVSGRGPCVVVSTSNGLTKGNGTAELPTFDSRTFTRRKGVLPASTDPNSASAFDPSSYEALVAGMSAISQGIDSLSRAPLFRSAIESSLSQTGTKRNGSASDLPDSTTGPPYPNEPIRSAFVTPIPQRTLCRNSGPLETELSRTDQVLEDPTEAATYYTLMVNSIRHLSLKLRQCSDKLVQRVNAEQSVSPLNVALNTDRRTSRASSTDSVPTSTKFALTDALENMRMISQQLQAVDQLFSQRWNEEQQQQTAPSQADLSGYTRQVDSNQFSFLPIDRIESSNLKNSRTLLPGLQTRSTTARVLHSGAQLTPKSGPSAFVLPGQVPPQMQTLKPPMDEEDEYY